MSIGSVRGLGFGLTPLGEEATLGFELSVTCVEGIPLIDDLCMPLERT